jgi:hypothetical protein
MSASWWRVSIAFIARRSQANQALPRAAVDRMAGDAGMLRIVMAGLLVAPQQASRTREHQENEID